VVKTEMAKLDAGRSSLVALDRLDRQCIIFEADLLKITTSQIRKQLVDLKDINRYGKMKVEIVGKG
jgi:hypothetical protein